MTHRPTSSRGARRRLAALIAALVLPACASAPGLQRVELQGSLADRLMAFEETLFWLVSRSASSQDAAQRVTAYCQENAQAIEEMARESESLSPDDVAALTKEVAQRKEKLVERASGELEGREHLLTDGVVIVAMLQCRQPPVPGATTEPSEGIID